MAWQSSRIIWDKNKTDSSEPQPVTIYDPTGTIYVAGNYALHSDHSGSVAEDYQLYLCKVEETGSDFISSDWELQKGVKNWYLIARRQFKKGARVIKSDTNGDTASLRLYKCISSMKQPNVWNPDEWEVVYQDVGVAYEVRDHKDVYYDSGSNRNKWHKMMYYLLPENPDKSDEEIEIFSEDRVYHKDDYVIKVKNNNEVALFKYISNTPRAGWDSTRWSEDVSVAEYEANIPYNKGDWIIRKYIEIYEFVIMEFQAGLRYYNGKYCLHIINPDDINPDIPVFNENVAYSRGDKVSYNRGLWEYNLNIPLSGPWIPDHWNNIGKTFPDWYRERILGGESLYGLYRANTTVCGSWNDSEWDLIIDGVIQIRGRDYNTRGLCIMQFQIGQNYLAGDVVIWTATNDTSEFGLSVAKVDIYNCSPAQAPPNETNWNNITETLENPDQYHVYKAKDNMTAGYNSHFRRDDWLIVTQKILPDDGLYGVIWEKYGKPGGGGGIPFGFPVFITNTTISDQDIYSSNLCNFYPFPGNNCLEIVDSFKGTDTYESPVGLHVGFLTCNMAKMNDGFLFYRFRKYIHLPWDSSDLNIVAQAFGDAKYLFYHRIGFRKRGDIPEARWYFGKIYKMYLSEYGVFGQTEVLNIPEIPDDDHGYSLFYSYYPYWNEDKDRCGMFLKQLDYYGRAGMILVEYTTTGAVLNDLESASSLHGTTWGCCNLSVTEKTVRFCNLDPDGNITPIDFFSYKCYTNSVRDNGIEHKADTSKPMDLYSGKITTGSIHGAWPPAMYTTDRILQEDPNLDPDFLAFPNTRWEEVSGQWMRRTSTADDVVLERAKTFANAYGITFVKQEDMSTEDDQFWYMWYHELYSTGANGRALVGGMKKNGYTVYDRSGNLYILAEKVLNLADYDRDVYNRDMHIWYIVHNSSETEFLRYMIDKTDPNNFADVIICGRDSTYIYYVFNTNGGASKFKVNYKTGALSTANFPMYYDIPIVGQYYRYNNKTYTKVRVYVPGYNRFSIPPADDNTYVLGYAIYICTYWTPYMTNSGGVAHSNDLLYVSSEYTEAGWVIYVPSPFTNDGSFGLAFHHGWNYGYPSYGGPGNNGFMNMS